MVLGTPTALTSRIDPAFTGVDGQTSAILQYPDGVQALVTCTLWSATPCRAWIGGELGRIDVDPTFYAPTTFTLSRRGAEPERFDLEPTLRGPGKGLRYEAAELVRCVGEGLTESPGLPLDETIAIMETLDAIRANAPAPAAGR
jgi:predicted dehydrogenase